MKKIVMSLLAVAGLTFAQNPTNHINGKTFVGVDSYLAKLNTAGQTSVPMGLSLGTQLNPNGQVQLILGPFGVWKNENQNGQMSLWGNIRYLHHVKTTSNFATKIGLGLVFQDYGNSSDVMFEFPVKFEYYVNNDFSISVNSGALLDLNLLHEPDGWGFGLGFGGVGATLWL